MSVIAEFRVRASDFELGQILAVEGITSVELETLVPVGDNTVPLFWVHNATRESLVDSIERHEAVNTAMPVDVFEDRTLFTLDWDAHQDTLFGGIDEYDGQLLNAVGTPEVWNFELRFSDHASLSGFTEHCKNQRVSLKMGRIYNPTEPDAGPWYGLTDRQREALRLAVERGYYDIPRGCTTKDLAAELDISDQAVTERLRRAIVALVSYTLLVTDSETAAPSQ
jgi:hypothetical protein